jgi:hypothetical protein
MDKDNNMDVMGFLYECLDRGMGYEYGYSTNIFMFIWK